MGTPAENLPVLGDEGGYLGLVASARVPPSGQGARAEQPLVPASPLCIPEPHASTLSSQTRDIHGGVSPPLISSPRAWGAPTWELLSDSALVTAG